MQTNEILLKPAAIFAFLKTIPIIFCAVCFLLLAWWLSPYFICLSFGCSLMAWYRFLFIRSSLYFITPEVIRIRRGIFFKRVDQIEMYRIKDYIITEPLILQIFKLMNLTLKSADPENPIIWLLGIPQSDIIDTIRSYVQEARMHNRIFEIN
jgi:uncharacterized membrane protein YdbT with pleckstrin-like domain